ncbi:sodium-coupled monocarboxylate transporter 1 isoform X2 [Tribolium castaneum]|uniref:sodium-coupled monocarboxylate transporter 1 isoform X2 n=1 Tax=Tribolium castaneum TaxID=7070 RepID=UPI00077D9F5D|nr:PREDICTED: sodium-coupled monocarboxylate transporter 1-like isoform X2 [Tribolium castaneum]|eukprot:XP_015835571.1 PREDICTED: sodium-coupled monocarboxylate transporter 1-like isoform X2 [Tribolium castaneum]
MKFNGSLYSRLKLAIFLVLVISHLSEGTNNDTKQETQCEENGKPKNTFSWPDYLVLGTMLLVSCGIGVFYGFIGEKHSSSDDFLLGGSSMGTFPMAMSLAASFITAIELLGNPAEMYNYGTQFLMICCAFILVVPLTARFYLPLFMELRLTSSYEYFSLRFNPSVRYFASGLYILQMVLYMSVAVYAPALALSHVTGLNVYVAVSVVYIVCIFYASQGGMKAVIIADTFQAGVLIGSILLILYLGEKFVGGTGVIWSHNYNTGRLEIFNLNPDPTIRHSFWSVVIGGTFYWMTMFCSNQASIQKYLSVENINQVKTALWTSCFGLILIYVINFYTGMIMVAHYQNCDPIKSGEISATDQILPLYVMSEMGHFKGVAGFFVAGIFAASLGTVASALNSLAAVTIQDFVCGAFKIVLHETKGAFWAKSISAMYGAISFVLVFVVAQLGSIMQVAISFNGMVGGVTLGLFSLGMFFPWASSKGALLGSMIAVCVISVMCVGQQIAIANGDLVEESKPTTVDNCTCFNASLSHENLDGKVASSSVFFLFRISYIWYSALGFAMTVLIGLVSSLLVGCSDPHETDWNLVSPPIKNLLFSLSNKTKERLNLPLKINSKKTQKNTFVGVFNMALDINDETKPKDSEKRSEKVRKISAPSSFLVTS